jgi:hypothetical protein
MDKLKQTLQVVMDFIKKHPLTSAVMAVMLLGMISFYWPTSVQAAAFRKTMASRNAQVNKIRDLMNTRVEIPPNNPDDPPTELALAVNEAANAQLKKVFAEMEGEYKGIVKIATDFNKKGHDLMLAGLFPEPLDNSKPFEARTAYIKAFETMYQSLNARMPMAKESIDKMVKDEETTYKRTVFTETLTPAQAVELARGQAKKIEDKQKEIAFASHIYAEPIVINTTTGTWQTGPFQLGDWAKPGGKPDMFDIWEGQMQLWIQQDLIKAIRMVNQMDDTTQNVTRLPIKQLISIIVKPGYVGHTPPNPSGASAAAPVDAATDAPPPDGAPPAASATSVRKLPDDYAVSITGRKTNPVYDVRHVVLSVLINSREIPKLLNAINNVNFMTVISTGTTNVDEFQMLSQGYYFGQGVDVVRLDLTIESIWLRSWLTGHESEAAAAQLTPPQPFDRGWLPDDVRWFLGIKPRAKGYVPKANIGATATPPM